MKAVRLALAIAVCLVIVGGYAASQIVYMQGPEAVSDFNARINQPSVHIAMLALFLAVVAMGFFSDHKEEPG